MDNCPVMEDAARLDIILSAEKSAKSNKRGLYSDSCEKVLVENKKNELLTSTAEPSSKKIFKNADGNGNKFIPLPGESFLF